jgi:SAM-dependent methyltransferase
VDGDLVERGMRGELEPNTVEFERFIDLTARRPTGDVGVKHYRNPKEHLKDFRLALRTLQLTANDRYLEIGFGGGQLLASALRVVKSAAGLDHSPDMLALASERNVKAIVSGRLQLVYGDVHKLPWPDRRFTCAAAVNMFFFVERPARCLAELFRVLKPGGRLVIVTISPGTSDDAGPWSQALRAYATSEMKQMLLGAGFEDVTVESKLGRQLVLARKHKTNRVLA